MISQMSMVAYEQKKEKFKGQRKLILDTIKRSEYGYTRQELSRKTGVAINSVCGRVKELICLGMIWEEGTKYNSASGCRNAVLKGIKKVAADN